MGPVLLLAASNLQGRMDAWIYLEYPMAPFSSVPQGKQEQRAMHRSHPGVDLFLCWDHSSVWAQRAMAVHTST